MVGMLFAMVGKIVLAEKTRTRKNVVSTLVIAFVIILCDVKKDFLVEKTWRNAVSTQVIALFIFLCDIRRGEMRLVHK